MESHLESTPVTKTQQWSGEPPDEEYKRYERQTRGKYKKLMTEFEFRCLRADMMNYHEASYYTKQKYRMESLAACLGGVSLATIGAPILELKANPWFRNISKLRGMGVAGVAAAVILGLMSEGSIGIIPSLRERADMHVTAAAAWQALAQRTRLYRIQLGKPNLDFAEYDRWYRDLITERKKICAMGSILQSTYDKFNDPKNVFGPFEKREELFNTFLEHEGMKESDFLG